MMTRIQLLASVLVGLTGCMEDQIQTTPADEPDPVVESPRVLDGLQVLYTFDEGKGLDVKDSSGVEPAFDLQLDNLVTNKWLPDGGIEIVGPSVITSPDVAEKVFVACVQGNAVSIEMWLESADVTQDATLFTYGKDGQRNASLDVGGTRYQGAVLTATPNPDIAGEMVTDTEYVQTPENIAAPTAQHVVFTRDATGSALYVNGTDTRPPGTQTPPANQTATPDQTEWSPAHQLVLGNVENGNSPWLGKIYLAAIYCKRLSPAEVSKNYSAGY
jgi:hypothetical protein